MPSAVCRAKNPAYCPYHGAVMRMEHAERTGNVEVYLEARKAVDSAERDNWNEEQYFDAMDISFLDPNRPSLKKLAATMGDTLRPDVKPQTAPSLNLSKLMGGEE